MKKFKTLVSLALTVAMLTWIPGVNAQKASAEERMPVTYILKCADSNTSWHYQTTTNGAWNDNGSHRELYYMLQSIQDGDHIIIEDSPFPLELNVPAALGSITFKHAHSANITVKSVDNVYVLRDSIAVINGYVFNGYVYDNGIANFNNNVANLFITKDRNAKQSIAVIGTVNYAAVSDTEKIIRQFYSFKANTFRIKEGNMTTAVTSFSDTPPVNVVP